ncbi:hypothetical protein [Fusobacterium necrophorum]|uniref:hypothetical protein n=1 Tax=Fusobacterium necrophorum TaxID=859 RepID=UPI0004826C11|nr:hypothetical protein [Fusobacterium necrophorum]MDK4521637.1 hypothetical protein [Fusobacterium necrophorum]
MAEMRIKELLAILEKELGKEASVAKVAKTLKIGKSTVYSLVKQGMLEKEEKYIKINSLLYYIK